MTEKKRRKFAHEILGLIGISALVAMGVFLLLSHVTAGAVEEYCFQKDVAMTEFDWIAVDRWIFGGSAAVALLGFSLLFLGLLGKRLAYVRRLTRGMDDLARGQEERPVPLEGNNELTELAHAINHMAHTRRQIRQREQTLAREKEQFIRTLSHDIRTPLTSLLAYSEYLVTEEELSPEQRRAHLGMLRRKAEQIRDLTDLLLEGGRRNPEEFADARLLMEQLAEEFQEELEEGFSPEVDLSRCGACAGTFDVQELRRIFDNLSSNVGKYADPAVPVCLTISMEPGELVIRQSNGVLSAATPAEGYQIGIASIRRIAQSYGGRVEVEQSRERFSIVITLSDF